MKFVCLQTDQGAGTGLRGVCCGAVHHGQHGHAVHWLECLKTTDWEDGIQIFSEINVML